MFNTLKMVFRLWKQYAKMDLLWLLRDTRYCLLQIFTDTVCAVASVSAVLLVSARFGGIGGMTFKEMLFMSGYAVITDGMLLLLFGGSNVAYISRIIGRGQLDHMLIQPVPLWLQLLTQGFVPFSGSSKLICGIALTVIALQKLHLAISVFWFINMLFYLICSIIVILSVVYIFSFSAFYAPVAAEEISMVVHELFTDTKYYPLAGLSARGTALFCTVIPVGLAAWFPANALLGKTPAGFSSSLMWIAAAVLAVITVLLFRKGIHHYEKFGSNRYTGFGHR